MVLDIEVLDFRKVSLCGDRFGLALPCTVAAAVARVVAMQQEMTKLETDVNRRPERRKKKDLTELDSL